MFSFTYVHDSLFFKYLQIWVYCTISLLSAKAWASKKTILT